MSEPRERESSFPHWVTWLSLAAAVLLFLGNTVPALREKAELREAQRELSDLRARYERAMQQARTAIAAPDDLQSLLVAIDRLGWTPAELLHSYPKQPGPR
ncbi:MAG: hypothetical protein Fur0037_19460 [Planctomycetota bacterium]